MTEQLTDAEAIRRLREAPRDTTVVIEQNIRLANTLKREGFHVIGVGGSQSETVECSYAFNGQHLADDWSALSCRSSQAICIGTKPLARLVEHMTVRAAVNGNTAKYRSRGWTSNLLENIHMLLEPSFGAYSGCLDGVPAFIVGAGASLDEDHPHLAELYRKGIVIGINGAARIASTCGIALTVEGNDVREKLGPLGPDTVRAFSVMADPNVMQHGEGPAMPVFSGALAAIPEWLTGHQRLACSGLGGTAALSLAERLGCNPIVLIGHEFRLKDGARIYPECLGIGESRAFMVEGENEKRWRFEWDEKAKSQKRQNPLSDTDLAIPLKNAAGETIWATRSFAGAASWFEQAAEKTKAQLIQASHGGAALKGWVSVPLAEVAKGLPGRDYELSPGENGLSPGVLLAWLEKQMLATQEAIKAGRELHQNPSRATIEAMRRAMDRTPLLDPWCHATIHEVAESRREGSPSPNAYTEHKAGLEHASGVGWAVESEGPSMLEALVMAASRIRAMGGSGLHDSRMPPGAADDLLRCALRSTERYENMSRARKALSWLRA